MTLTRSKPLLRAIKEAQPDWFSRENKRFFNDVSYRGYYGKKTGNPYLVRSTYAWTDMFDHPRRLHFRINQLNPDTKKILDLLNQEFANIFEVKAWLRDN